MPLTVPQSSGSVPFTPKSNVWQYPANFVAAAAGAITSGTLYLTPTDVGPVTRAYNAIGVGVTTAQVAGTTTTTVGVYRDDGTGGYPNLVGGPLTSGTIVLTSTGNAFVTLGVSGVPLAPGRYWTALLYVASSAPTTAPQVYQTSTSFSGWTSTIGGALFRGLSTTGQSALPTTQIGLSAVSGNCPVVCIRGA